jgi:hypothetical protein
MRILAERSAFCVCRCSVHVYRSRRSHKELLSIGVATIAGSIGYEAPELPWSYRRTELLRRPPSVRNSETFAWLAG